MDDHWGSHTGTKDGSFKPILHSADSEFDILRMSLDYKMPFFN